MGDFRDELVRAVLIEEVVERKRAVLDWLDEYVVTLEGDVLLDARSYEQVAPYLMDAVVGERNAETVRQLAGLLVTEGVERGLLKIVDLGKRGGAYVYRTTLKLVRVR